MLDSAEYGLKMVFTVSYFHHIFHNVAGTEAFKFDMVKKINGNHRSSLGFRSGLIEKKNNFEQLEMVFT